MEEAQAPAVLDNERVSTGPKRCCSGCLPRRQQHHACMHQHLRRAGMPAACGSTHSSPLSGHSGDAKDGRHRLIRPNASREVAPRSKTKTKAKTKIKAGIGQIDVLYACTLLFQAAECFSACQNTALLRTSTRTSEVASFGSV